MFLKAQIIASEITRNAQNEITKIWMQVQMQDDSIAGVKEFDYVIDGGTLDEIRGDLKSGVLNLIKEQARTEHPKWLEETAQAVETKSELTPLQIKGQFGDDQITSLM